MKRKLSLALLGTLLLGTLILAQSAFSHASAAGTERTIHTSGPVCGSYNDGYTPSGGSTCDSYNNIGASSSGYPPPSTGGPVCGSYNNNYTPSGGSTCDSHNNSGNPGGNNPSLAPSCSDYCY